MKGKLGNGRIGSALATVKKEERGFHDPNSINAASFSVQNIKDKYFCPANPPEFT